MAKLRIMLADDHQIVRQGLKALLEAEPDMEVVADVADGISVADEVERVNPDVLVLDLMMPGLNGLDVTRIVKQRSPQVHTIILSMHANEAYVAQALRNGASGYVLKDASTDTLVDAIREVVSGKRYLCQPFSEYMIEDYRAKANEAPIDLYESLTHREREVMQLVAEGFSNAEIAERLFISHRTVEVHRAKLMDKLRLKNHTQLVKYAIQRGLLVLEN